MYECSICHEPVAVDHVNPPIKPCGHTGTIYASFQSELHGESTMTAHTENNNLTPESQQLTKTYLIMLAAQEFFKTDKAEIFVKNQHVSDEPTGRRFEFTITGREI